MLKAYVGIARPDGLVCFLPEFDEATRIVASAPASFWAVVADDIAEQVECELRAGQPFRAMQVLDAMANDILPLGCLGERRQSVEVEPCLAAHAGTVSPA